MGGMICPMTKMHNHSFSEYEEPNTWRETYYPLVNQYKDSVINPIEFDAVQEPIDYYKLRDKIVQEELELHKVICPVENIYDPSILYTCSSAQIEKSNDQKPKSLFTIIDIDDEDDDYED